MSPHADPERVASAAEQAAAVLATVGFPRMPARVLVTLLASESGSLTADELAERLGVSAAAISGGVRYLELIAIVHRVAQPGSRRRRWEIVDEWYGALTSQTGVYDRTAAGIERLAAELEAGSDARARAEDSAAFLRFLGQRVPDLLREWQERRGASRPRS